MSVSRFLACSSLLLASVAGQLVPPPGGDWTFCVGENGNCNPGGTRQIAYGRDAWWSYLVASSTTSCTNPTFGGDPISGKYKHCWTRSALAAPSGITSPDGQGWVYCASERSQCSFSGAREVAYGRDSSWNYAPHSDGTLCANSVFGDPISGSTKHCWVRSVYAIANSDSPAQAINLMGGDMERSAAFLTKASNSQQVANWVYQDTAFEHCRVSFDRKQELTEGSPNLAFYTDAISGMKLVQNARSNVKFWTCLKSDYDGYGTTNNLPDWIYTGGGYNGGSYDPTLLNTAKYARFLCDYLKHMHDNGVTISYLSVGKEWIQVIDTVRERDTINSIKALLQTAAYSGVPEPQFYGPSSWGLNQAINFLNSAISINSDSLYSGIGTHWYDGAADSKWGTLVSKANSKGLPVWQTESSYGGHSRTNGAEVPFSIALSTYAKRAVWYRQGVQGELFFEQWSRGVAAETRAIYFTNGGAGTRLRPYYIMRQFANIAANSNYIPTTSLGLTDVEMMAFLQGTRLTIFVINSSEHAYADAGFSVIGTIVGSIQTTVWLETNQLDGARTTFQASGSSTFTRSLNAKSITSFVMTVA